MRTHFSMVPFLIAPLLSLCHVPTIHAEDARPNIVLVMADDQGWADIGYQGNGSVSTPNFDRAAAAGLTFDRFYAAAPVCSPTRASVLTGRHPNRSGVFKWGYPLRPQEETLADQLRDAGYATGHFGKWHLGSVRRDSPVHPGQHGFDYWVSAPNFFDNDPILSHQGRAVQHVGESSMVTVDAAIDWITTVAKHDLPFFAVVWFGSPHSPHRSIAADRGPYLDEKEAIQHFRGEITGMDRAFGKLRVVLSDLGVRDNTIIWYCSDNGALPKVGSTGGFRAHKGKVYEGGLLVPSFIEWPDVIKSPSRTSVRCNTSDITPTLLELASITGNDTQFFDGISLAELIRTQTPPADRAMGFWDYPIRGISTPSAKWMSALLEAQKKGEDLLPHESSLRARQIAEPLDTHDFPGHSAWLEGNWKLHRIQRQDAPEWELYDLKSDPHETNNVIEAHPEEVETMKKAMEAWLLSVVESYNGPARQSSESASEETQDDAVN